MKLGGFYCFKYVYMIKGGEKLNKKIKGKTVRKAGNKKIAEKSAVKKTAKKKNVQKKVKLAVKVGSKTSKIANSSHIVAIEKNENLEKEIKAEKAIRSSGAKQPRIISEKLEKDKQLIMWSGITFFMVLIMFVWVFQIRHSISQTKLENNNQKTEEWKKVFSDLEKNISDLKTDLEKVKQFSEEPEKKFDEKLIEKVKNNIASSSTEHTSDIASSTSATSSELKIN